MVDFNSDHDDNDVGDEFDEEKEEGKRRRFWQVAMYLPHYIVLPTNSLPCSNTSARLGPFYTDIVKCSHE